MPEPTSIPEAAAGALAADLLIRACDPADSLRLACVRELATALGRELRALSDRSPELDTLAGVAARLADLASLAACNLPHVSPPRVPEAVAATYLASGAARAVGVRSEAGARGLGTPRGDYLVREVRGTAWRARLAGDQAEASLNSGDDDQGRS